MRKIIVAILATVVLVLTAAGCSSISTEPDEAGLHYKGGPLSSTKFANCVNPSQRNYDGPSDPHYTYPFGQRTFEFRGGDGADGAAISVVSKDNVTMTVSGVATFALNTDCRTLRQFHERIGAKFNASNEDGDVSLGWTNMLRAYMQQPLEKALDAVSKEYGYRDLYSDPKVKESWEEKVGSLTSQFIKDQAGASYFCKPDFAGAGDCGNLVLTIQTPVPPENIRNALAAEQEAVAQNNAQKQKNTVAATKYDSFAVCKTKGIAESTCLILYGIDSGKVTVYPIPQGSGLNLNAK